MRILKPTKKQNTLLTVLPALLLVITSMYILVIWLPEQERASFENHYLSIMKNLNNTVTKDKVRCLFERDYNFKELYGWVHEKLEFVPLNETFERHTDPSKILKSGKGRCEEFSILYVAACLAHHYQSRIVVAVDVSNPINWIGQHVWTEVRVNGQWIHVDPSDKVWNEPYRYRTWSWGKSIGSKVRIYAFEDSKYEDVTFNYK